MTPPLVSRLLSASLLAGALIVAGPRNAVAETPAPRRLLDLLAQGKVETDLGRFDAAVEALAAVADAPDAPPELRAEALVRLGAARRGAGDFEGAVRAFERAASAPGAGPPQKALLVQALGGALPGEARWAEVWSQVSFTVDRSDPKRPTLAIGWPGVPARPAYRGRPVTLDIDDGDLGDLFRLVADISGLNVVVLPGVRGRFTLRADDVPWDRYLDEVLAAHGLAYQWQDNVLLVAPPPRLPAPRCYTGRRIDLDWGTGAREPGRDLRDGLAELAAIGEATVAIDPVVRGSVVLKLSRVRWDQAFDIVVRVNGCDWSQDGKALQVFPRGK